MLPALLPYPASCQRARGGPGQCLLRGGATVSGRKGKAEMSGEGGVTAMELAGAQINANEGAGERNGEGLCFQTKALP